MEKINQLERGPKSHKISTISTIKPSEHRLDSDMTLFACRTKGIGAIKFEIVFEAGRPYESKKLASQACGDLLSEGCMNMNSSDISEFVDYEGAYLSTHASSDFINIKLTCAKKSFLKLLQLLGDIIEQPTFSSEELRIYIERMKQRMAINLSKNDVISYRTITENIYGQDNPYGYNSTYEILDNLESEDLSAHYLTNCNKESAHFFLSGDYESQHIEAIYDLSARLNNGSILPVNYQKTYSLPATVKRNGRENQTSLKLGSPLFSRRDKDYPGVYLLNTILGGYFGSRLMKNIREKRGYTYNIYSMLDTYKHSGAWVISCELDQTNVDKAITQIDLEFQKLRRDPVPEEELLMVKNYLMGNFLSTINGPFKAINPFKTEVLMDLKCSFYDDLFKTIRDISQGDILRLADDYLRADKFWKVIVGKD